MRNLVLFDGCCEAHCGVEECVDYAVLVTNACLDWQECSINEML